ncbi:MAG: 3-deoxy-manno-octulosonate cytidylyltransferase [Kiritimatiellae bacterium]|nr:3-deoxy-manno-octulosonate cytidylyltransferase [Kiritimatiellia bacterium]
MKTIGVIPSRYGSTRFPGKSLAPICGKPLVRWVAEACLRAKTLDEVVVATDDERIAAAVEGTGARAVMTPSDLPSGTDRVAVAARPEDGDVVVNIQGDEPLIDPALVDRVADALRDDREARFQMSTACAPVRSAEDLAAPSVVKVVTAADGGALYFSRHAIPFKRDGEPDLASGLWRRHVGIYGYRGAFLKRLVATPPCALELAEKLEQLRALWLGGRIAVVETDELGIGVDRPEDVAAVEAVMRARGL